MKKGETYIGDESGLWLKVRDKKGKNFVVEVQRRKIDRKTGEITYHVNEREVPEHLVHFLLLGYSYES